MLFPSSTIVGVAFIARVAQYYSHQYSYTVINMPMLSLDWMMYVMCWLLVQQVILIPHPYT